MKKFLILGASRGLGNALYKVLYQKNDVDQFLLVSRHIEKKENDFQRTQLLNQDFSQTPVNPIFFSEIIQFQPTHIIYCAGGGPYGYFQDKKWSDHQWSLNVNFLYPAQIIHKILIDQQYFKELQVFTAIGSKIAESSPDFKASSYCSGKHALKGLITTLQAELKSQNQSALKFKLYSPGYIKTDLLPKNAEPRKANQAQDVLIVASDLAEFIDSDDELR